MFESDIEKLATLKQGLNEVKARLESSRELWALQNKPLLDSEADLANQINDLDKAIREQALAIYTATGDKKPHPAVGVRVNRRGDWDEKQAVEYCISKRLDLLATKRTDYEKALKDDAHDPEMPGTVKEVPTGTISPDLTEYLPRQHNPAMFEYMRELQLSGTADMFKIPDLVAAKFEIDLDEAREVFFAWGGQG